jgi:hypothetical protein
MMPASWRRQPRVPQSMDLNTSRVLKSPRARPFPGARFENYTGSAVSYWYRSLSYIRQIFWCAWGKLKVELAPADGPTAVLPITMVDKPLLLVSPLNTTLHIASSELQSKRLRSVALFSTRSLPHLML